jgi:hypothetical protein
VRDRARARCGEGPKRPWLPETAAYLLPAHIRTATLAAQARSLLQLVQQHVEHLGVADAGPVLDGNAL